MLAGHKVPTCLEDIMSAIDGKTKELLALVEKKRAELGSKPSKCWKTSAIFKFNDRKQIDFNAESDPHALVEVMSFLLSKKSASDEAYERLGVEPKPFKYGGYQLESWERDIKLRIDILLYDERKSELDKLEKELNSLLSDEGRAEAQLDKIASLLK